MDTASLEEFLEELASILDERLRKQDKKIEELRKELKKAKGPQVNRSVMKVLRGQE